MTPNLIHHLLEQSAGRHPRKVAIVHNGMKITYEEVNSRANRLAASLLDMGLTQGDRVALILENSVEYVASYYGVLKAGGVVAPLNTDLKPEGLRPILSELEPKTIISSAKFERLLQSVPLVDCGVKSLILSVPRLSWSGNHAEVFKLEDLIRGNSLENPDLQIKSTELATIIYTSGSTGSPKGAMLSHRNIVSNVLSICQYLHLTSEDIQMVVLPFFYVMGKSLLNTHFAAGGTVVINNKFAFPAAVLNEMVSENVTGFSGVPSTYAYLLHRSPLTHYRDRLTSLRYCSQAGGHMSRFVKESLRRALPEHVRIYIMYGATEAAARLSYLEPDRYVEKMDSIGKAIPGVTLRILDEQGQEASVGRVGELVARGPNIMMGYWKDPEATGKVLREGWYQTGDEAFRDEEGFFYVVGRKDDLIKVGGHRLHPRQVEDRLMESGQLVEVFAVGVPDSLLGHRLIVFAAPSGEGQDADSLLRYCAGTLPRYMIPGEIRMLRSLPKRANGKVDRNRCLDLIQVTEGKP